MYVVGKKKEHIHITSIERKQLDEKATDRKLRKHIEAKKKNKKKQTKKAGAQHTQNNNSTTQRTSKMIRKLILREYSHPS